MSNVKENINELMTYISSLPKKDFDDAVLAISAMGIGTLITMYGEEFLDGFIDAALKSEELPVIVHCHQVN